MMHLLSVMFPSRFEAALMGFAFGVATATLAFGGAILMGLQRRKGGAL